MNRHKIIHFFVLVAVFEMMCIPVAFGGEQHMRPAQATRFAVIGDYGYYNKHAVEVARLVKKWKVDFIITVGDNNYRKGRETTIDKNVGKLYQEYIYPYKGTYGPGAEYNRFFPTLGNHDLKEGKRVYFDYFTLPGYEQYYDFVRGPVHFFTIDSTQVKDARDVANAKQILWLEVKLLNSKSKWNIVYFHQPPFSSGKHGSYRNLRLPYKQWGATAVISGDNHVYERIMVEGIPYFVNGLGGKSIYPFRRPPVEGTAKRYNKDYGAMIVDATEACILFRFVNVEDQIIDSYEMCEE